MRLLQAARAIPSLAWVPLLILWLGIDETSKITLVVIGVSLVNDTYKA